MKLVNQNNQPTAQCFKNLLQQSTLLQSLLSKVTERNKLNQILKKYLIHIDPELANNCEVANLNQGRLILAVTSPVWHHRLRFLKSELLSNLRKEPEWCGLIAIELFVQQFDKQTVVTQASMIRQSQSLKQQVLPETQNFSTTAAKKTNISLKTIELLNNAAKHVSSTKLATALSGLAKYGEKQKNP